MVRDRKKDTGMVGKGCPGTRLRKAGTRMVYFRISKDLDKLVILYCIDRSTRITWLPLGLRDFISYIVLYVR